MNHAHCDVHAHGSLAEHRDRTDAICVDHVSFAYDAGSNKAAADGVARLALRDVTLHIEQGSSLGIIGPNGAGKSTLLKIMLGLLEGYRGSVRVLGLSPALPVAEETCSVTCRSGKISNGDFP